MRVGELCQKAGVTKELIRHYEALGLISSSEVQAGSRTYRAFNDDVLYRLSLIKKGKAIGLSLKQIKPLIDAFLNQEMSEREAIDVLQQQYWHMEQVIQQAQEVQSLIKQHIDKVSGKTLDTCESLERLKSS